MIGNTASQKGVGAAFVLCVACIGGMFILSTRPVKQLSIEQIEAEIKNQIPEGSTNEQVDAWFASHCIETSDIMDGERKVGVGATIPNSNLLESAEIRIDFYFDEKGRVKKSIVQRFEFFP